MSQITVDIVTPLRRVFSGPATEIRVPGALGEFGVLPGHTIFLSLLRAGVATVNTADGVKRFVIGRGFAEAGPERLVLLTDSCEDADSVDKAAAREAANAAEALLISADPGSDAFLTAAADLELNTARLEA